MFFGETGDCVRFMLSIVLKSNENEIRKFSDFA